MKTAFKLFCIAIVLIGASRSAAQQQPPTQQQIRIEQQQQEAERRKALDSILPASPLDSTKTLMPEFVERGEPCLPEIMPGNSESSLHELSLTEWLAGGETTQIP